MPVEKFFDKTALLCKHEVSYCFFAPYWSFDLLATYMYNQPMGFKSKFFWVFFIVPCDGIYTDVIMNDFQVTVDLLFVGSSLITVVWKVYQEVSTLNQL